MSPAQEIANLLLDGGDALAILQEGSEIGQLSRADIQKIVEHVLNRQWIAYGSTSGCVAEVDDAGSGS